MAIRELTMEELDQVSGGGSLVSDVAAGALAGGIASAATGLGIIGGLMLGGVAGGIYHVMAK